MEKGWFSWTREPLHRPFIGVEPSGRAYCSNARANSQKRLFSAVISHRASLQISPPVRKSDTSQARRR
jgi:hypothetical protein